MHMKAIPFKLNKDGFVSTHIHRDMLLEREFIAKKGFTRRHLGIRRVIQKRRTKIYYIHVRHFKKF